MMIIIYVKTRLMCLTTKTGSAAKTGSSILPTNLLINSLEIIQLSCRTARYSSPLEQPCTASGWEGSLIPMMPEAQNNSIVA